MTPDSGGIMLESLETEVSLCLFPFSWCLQDKIHSLKKIRNSPPFQTKSYGYHFGALALWSQIPHPSSVSYFLTHSKKYRCLKIPDCKDKKEGFPLCECQESIFLLQGTFEDYEQVDEPSEIHSSPCVLPGESKHRCMAANLPAIQARWIYMVP